MFRTIGFELSRSLLLYFWLGMFNLMLEVKINKFCCNQILLYESMHVYGLERFIAPMVMKKFCSDIRPQ